MTLVERGGLTEGHGRALLLTDDHDARRRLARTAAAEGWSVRTTEAKARAAASAPRRRAQARRGARGLHPDQVEAIARISDALTAALGSEVRVRPSGNGYRAELQLSGLDDALDRARRLPPRPPRPGGGGRPPKVGRAPAAIMAATSGD